MTVEISPRALKQVRAGSLWIFANEFVSKMNTLTPGEWGAFESRRQFVGYGYVNPHSLIAGRICSLKPITNRKEMIQELLKAALQKRGGEMTKNSYRAVFSESDSLPGLIIDVYGKTVVAQINTKGMDEAKADIVLAIKEILTPKNLVLRGDSSIRTLEGAPNYVDVVEGSEEELKDSEVEEDGLKISANFIGGQKTGFFLDQRENRRHLKKHSEGKTILDLCSYSGGWGLSALKGGAREVTFVDQSQEALALTKKGTKLNHFEETKGKYVVSDVFDFLKANSQQFDIVVCDPPAFVKSKKNLSQAIRGYKKLNAMAAEKVKPGGFLYSCSCSFHLSEADFELLLREVFQELGRKAQVVYRGLQPLDHPWIINRPEGNYLKCYCLRLE